MPTSRRVSALLTGLAATALAPPLAAQRIVDRQPVTQAPPFDIVESFLAIDPTNGNRVLAAAMSGSADSSVVYVSVDGGKIWRYTGPVPGAAFPGGDPMLAFDETGTAYFTTITPRFTVWRSEDSGDTWAGPSQVPGGSYDRQWIAPYHDARRVPRVVAVGKTPQRGDSRLDEIAIAISTDGGRSFPSPALVRPDSGFLHVVSDVRVTRDGRILVPYFVNYGGVPGTHALLRGRLWMMSSVDHGASWTDTPIARTASYGNANWTQAMKGLGGGRLAIDETGGVYDGHLYITWPLVIEERIQIVLAVSRDGGHRWSEPVRVNDNGFRSNLSTPAVAVNDDGVVAVVWYDRRNDPRDLCYQPFVALSHDGGRNFGNNQMVDQSAGCFDERSRWLNGGDTIGLVAQPGGTFRLAWINGRRGSLELHTAVIVP